MISVRVCVVGFASLALAASPAAAQPTRLRTTTTVTVGPAADAFVCGAPARAGQNFGAAGALAFAPAGAIKGDFQTLLRFDLASTAAELDSFYWGLEWRVETARLDLWAVPPLNSIFNAPSAGAWAVDWIASDAWAEGTGTPSAPTVDGVTFNSLGSFLSPADVPLGVFSFSGGNGGMSAVLGQSFEFNQDVETGGLLSLRVRSQGGASVFNASEFVSAPAQQPRLVLVVSGPCRADLVCNPIPGAPCNPALNNDDFWYFLVNFAAANLAVVDMTTTAVPGTPGYGYPNGIINNDDFFFYLALFAKGC